MLKAVNLSDTVIFESPRDPDKGQAGATRFKLGAIPSRVYTRLVDGGTYFTQDKKNEDGVQAQFSNNRIARDIVKFGLKGVENFPADFKTVKEKFGSMEFDVVSEEFLDVIDLETLREVSLEIRKLCEFDEVETKNSAG